MSTIPHPFDIPGAGFVLIAAGEKFPPIEKSWQERPHSFQEAAAHVETGGNVGLIAGLGGLGGLDQDDPQAFVGLKLPETLTWETRPGRLGMAFKWSDDRATALSIIGKKADLAQLKLFKAGQPCGEIKLERVYQVIPPSWKEIAGQRVDYRLIESVPPVEISLEWLLGELQKAGITFSRKAKSRLDANAAKLESMTKEARQKRAVSDEARNRSYAEAALVGEVEAVRSAPVGDRNNRLNTAACKLGSLVSAGVLSRGEIERELAEAAMDIDLEPSEISATIGSGLEAGMRTPRAIPEPGPAVSLEIDDISVVTGRESVLDADGNNTGQTTPERKLSPQKAARAIQDKLGIRRDHAGNLYQFTGRKWEQVTLASLGAILDGILGSKVTAHGLKEISWRLEGHLQSTNFDPEPWLLGVHNGVVDIRTGEFRPVRDGDLITDCVPVEHDPGARCPEIIKFIESLTPSYEDRITLLDFIAMGAYRRALPVIGFLTGHGSTGASTFTGLIQAFYGDSNLEAVPLQELISSRFALGSLQRSRYSIGTETNVGKAGTDAAKRISGGDWISSDVKNRDRVRFKAWSKLLFTTNSLPRFNDDSYGFVRRFAEVKLPYRFVDEPDKGQPKERQKDPNIAEKICSAGELSGLLNLILERTPWIVEHKRIFFKEQMGGEYLQTADSVTTFLSRYYTYYPEQTSTKPTSKQLHENFKRWAEATVSNQVGDPRRFGRLVRAFCDNKPGRETTVDGQTVTVYPGLTFDEEKFNREVGGIESKLETGSDRIKTGYNTGIENDPCISNTGLTGLESKKHLGIDARALWEHLAGKYGEMQRSEEFYSGDPVFDSERSNTSSGLIRSDNPVSATQRPDLGSASVNPVSALAGELAESVERRRQAEERAKTPDLEAFRGKVVAHQQKCCHQCGTLLAGVGGRQDPETLKWYCMSHWQETHPRADAEEEATA